VTGALRVYPATSLDGKDQEVLATPTNCLESYRLERAVIEIREKIAACNGIVAALFIYLLF